MKDQILKEVDEAICAKITHSVETAKVEINKDLTVKIKDPPKPPSPVSNKKT